MTVTRWPQASQRETWPNRFVPVPPPCGCVQSRSVSTRMCNGRGLAMTEATLPDTSEADPPVEALLWRPVTGCRRLIPVLASAALAASAAPARAQSGAGDDQYTDPFGGTSKKSQKSTTTSSAARKQAPKSQTTGPPLSNQPPVSSNNSSTTGTTPSTPSPAPAASAQLPRTGFEVPGIALLGAGLLASGIGLRMRTVDETIF